MQELGLWYQQASFYYTADDLNILLKTIEDAEMFLKRVCGSNSECLEEEFKKLKKGLERKIQEINQEIPKIRHNLTILQEVSRCFDEIYKTYGGANEKNLNAFIEALRRAREHDLDGLPEIKILKEKILSVIREYGLKLKVKDINLLQE